MAGIFRYTLGRDYSAPGDGEIGYQLETFSSQASTATVLLRVGDLFGLPFTLLNVNNSGISQIGNEAGAPDKELAPTSAGYLFDWTGQTIPVEFIGGSFGDQLVGGAGADALKGGGGNDTLTGGGGSDVLDGEAGTGDVAVFSGNFSDYSFSIGANWTTSSTWSITDKRAGKDGTDTVVNVEKLQFTDGLVSVETSSLTVTTLDDVVNPFDGQTSLREAIAYANAKANTNADTPDVITFDASLNGAIYLDGGDGAGGKAGGELVITDAVTIDGDGRITISGDANRDDKHAAGSTVITDVTASYGGTAGAADDYLDDNSRIVNVTSSTAATTLKGLTITGGRTTADGLAGRGGAIRTSATLTVVGSQIAGNSIGGFITYGGGIYGFGDVTLIGSTVSGNTTTAGSSSGGGVFSAGALNLTNSTVVGNSSSQFGGGAYSEELLTLTNTTVSGNSTSVIGGGLFAYKSLVLGNSIVLGNFAGAQDSELSVNSSTTASGLNIVGTGSDIDASDGIINADPALVFAKTTTLGSGVIAGCPTSTHMSQNDRLEERRILGSS